VAFLRALTGIAVAGALIGCGGSTLSSSAKGSSATPSSASSPSQAPPSARVEHGSGGAVRTGEPIDPSELSGRIVFDDFEDLFLMDVDGSNLVTVAGNPGSEFDGELSPDGAWVVYRDSTRGINTNDEVVVARTDGSERRDLSNDPSNDWGPTWSPDGAMIAYNSDRDGTPLAGYVVDADGSNLRRLDIQGWFEYPSFSPDGSKLAFMGHHGSDYDIFVADVQTGAVEQLTDAPGSDGWPAWSPDGSMIAFSSERDDCGFAARDVDCWRDGPDDQHADIWLMDADGGNQRRLTPEVSQFVAWSPDGSYLVVSGHALFVVRPDGTGRLELRAEGIDRPLGGIPDWG
jgi:TolB protein